MDTTSLRLPDDTFAEIDRLIDETGKKKSEILREAVEIYLDGAISEDEYAELSEEYESLQKRVDGLESDVERLEKRNRELIERREELQERHDRVRTEYENLQSEHDRIIEQKDEEIRELRVEVERKDKQNLHILQQRDENKALVAFAEERRKVISGEKRVAPMHTRLWRSVFGYDPNKTDNEQAVVVDETD